MCYRVESQWPSKVQSAVMLLSYFNHVNPVGILAVLSFLYKVLSRMVVKKLKLSYLTFSLNKWLKILKKTAAGRNCRFAKLNSCA